MADLEERLTAHLREQRTRIPIDQEPVGEIEARGRARRRRHQVGVGVASAVVVVAALALGSLAFRDDGVSVATAQGDGAEVSPAEPNVAPAEAAADATLDWKVTLDAPLGGFAVSTATVGDTLYVLSTAPGVESGEFADPMPEMAVYASSESGQWNETTLSGELFPTDLAANAFGVYVVGTGPGTAGGEASLVVGTSTDGAVSFETSTLPLAATRPDLPADVFGSGYARAAATDNAALAVVTTEFFVDATPLLPDGSADGNTFAEASNDGVTVYDVSELEDHEETCDEPPPEETDDWDGCEVTGVPAVTAFFTWAELGLDPVTTRQLEVFSATADGTFVPATAPPITGMVDQVGAASTYFYLREVEYGFNGPGGSRLWFSDDAAQSWTAALMPADIGWVSDMAAVGDRLVVLAYTNEEGAEADPAARLYTSDDRGRSWTEISIVPDAPTGEYGPWGLSAGTTGAAVLLAGPIEEGTELPPDFWMAMSTDLIVWDVVPLSDIGVPEGAVPTGIIGVGDTMVSVGGVVYDGTSDDAFCCVVESAWEAVATWP